MDDSDDGVKVSLCSIIHYLPFDGLRIHDTKPKRITSCWGYRIHLSRSLASPQWAFIMSCSHHLLLQTSYNPLTIQALATKSLAELLYPPSGFGQNTSLLVDIVSEYHGNSRSLENAVQKVS
jgi:hypothetical protein